MMKQSVWPWMGCYVVARNFRGKGAQAGTWRVLFEVPKRLRPPGWPPTIELPRERPYCKGPDDLECIIRIKEDAAALNAALKAGREPDDDTPPLVRVGSIPWLIEKWGGKGLMDAVELRVLTMDAALAPDPRSREEWQHCEPRTRKLYIQALRHVQAWSISIRHLPVTNMKPTQVRDFLNRFKPGQRKNIRDVLSQLFGIAGEESVLETNPLNGKKAGMKRQMKKRVKGGRKTKVERWTRQDVEYYSRVARTETAWQSSSGKRVKRTWPGGSIMVRLMYETAADSTDVVTWTRATHIVEREGYRGIDYDRGKTGHPTFIPLSERTLKEIDESGTFYLVTDPFGQPYDSVIGDARMRGHAITLQERVVKLGGARRVYDYLRHSAATEAEEAGVELDKIRHLTAHKDSAMNREVYVQQSAKITREIQRKRGLIAEENTDKSATDREQESDS